MPPLQVKAFRQPWQIKILYANIMSKDQYPSLAKLDVHLPLTAPSWLHSQIYHDGLNNPLEASWHNDRYSKNLFKEGFFFP